MMIQQSLHGREVCASGLHGGFVLVGEEEDDDSAVSAWERGLYQNNCTAARGP